VVEINDPKNTALLVLLPSACWLRVISGAQIRALGMKRKPRCRGGEETGECAAELEVMVMVMARLVLVITMFCSSSAPLSLSLTHSSLSLSLPPSVSLSVLVQNKSNTSHQKPSSHLIGATVASLDDIMLTSPLGQYEEREDADRRKNTKVCGELRGKAHCHCWTEEGRTLIGGVQRPWDAMGRTGCSQIGSMVICLSGRFLI